MQKMQNLQFSKILKNSRYKRLRRPAAQCLDPLISLSLQTYMNIHKHT